MFGADGAEVRGGPRQSLFDYRDGNPKAAAREAAIVAVDVEADIANARVESGNWNGEVQRHVPVA